MRTSLLLFFSIMAMTLVPCQGLCHAESLPAFDIRSAGSPADTVSVTKGKTVHILLGEAVRYASLSSSGEIESRIVSEDKGIISFRAKTPFTGSRNLTLILENDRMRVFIIRYTDDVDTLLIDYSEHGDKSDDAVDRDNMAATPSSSSYVHYRRINHISDRCGSLIFSVEQIEPAPEGTEMLLSLENRSASKFVPNSVRVFQRSHSIGSRVLALDKETRYSALEGNLATLPGQKAYMKILIPQTTLAKHAMIEIYLHEYTLASSMRLRIYPRDIEKSKNYCSTKRY